MTRISVDLPEPLAPRLPKISPRASLNVTSSTATLVRRAGDFRQGRPGRLPETNCLDTPRRLSAVVKPSGATTFTIFPQHLIGTLTADDNQSAARARPMRW